MAIRTRIRVLTPVVLAACVGATLAAQAQKVALVTVVADDGGRISDLAAKDVVVHEEKADRQVLSVEPATEPLMVTLLLDVSAPPAGRQFPVRDLRSAVSSFVKSVTSGHNDTQIGIMLVAGAAQNTLEFTTKLDEVDRVVQRLYPDQQGSAVMLEAITDASKKFADKPTPRRALVVVDFNSPEGSASRMVKSTPEDVRKSGATVWSASVRGTTESASPREAVINLITQASGGLRLTSVEPSGLEAMLAKIANSITAQYSVTFARPDTSPAKGVRMETSRGAKILLTPWMR